VQTPSPTPTPKPTSTPTSTLTVTPTPTQTASPSPIPTLTTSPSPHSSRVSWPIARNHVSCLYDHSLVCGYHCKKENNIIILRQIEPVKRFSALNLDLFSSS
jgi:hypothetical protein